MKCEGCTMARSPFDPFNDDFDKIFNQFLGDAGNSNAQRRYMINGQEVTPEQLEVVNYKVVNLIPNKKLHLIRQESLKS